MAKAEITVLEATRRDEFGKGAARRARREGKLPVVVYGHGQEPSHLLLDYHDAYMLIRSNLNSLLTLRVEGQEQLVLVKEAQRNPLTRNFEHLDLLRVKADEKVEVEVPVEITGEPASGAIAAVELMNLLVKAPANDIPEAIVVDVEGLGDGANVTVADVKFPEDVISEMDPEEVVVVVSVPQEADLPEEAAADADEAGAEAAAE